MMLKQFIFLSSLLILLLPAGCKKNDISKNENGQVVIHGNITLVVNAMHHTWPVSNIGVHLVKDVAEYPGPDTTKYQIHARTDLTGNAMFQNLFPGRYFVYAEGFDNNFGTNVIGYSSLQIPSVNTDNEFDVTLYVSE